MSKVQIIGAPQSNYTRTVRMVAHELGIDCDHVAAPPHSPDVDAIHPLGKIPVMRHGDVELCESRAIVGYLEEAFGGSITPADPAAAARIEQWVSMLTTHMIPTFIGEYLFAYIFPGTDDGQPDRARIDNAVPDVEKNLGILANEIAASGDLGGTSFNLASAYLAPALAYLKDLPESGALISKTAALSSWLDAVEKRPSFVATRVPEPETA